MNKEQRLNILFTGIRWIIELCFEILCFNLMMRKKTLWKLFSLQSRIHLWDCSISNGTSTKQRLTTSTYCSTIIRKVLLWHNSFNALECKLILWKCCFTAKIVVVVFFSFCCEKKILSSDRNKTFSRLKSHISQTFLLSLLMKILITSFI